VAAHHEISRSSFKSAKRGGQSRMTNRPRLSRFIPCETTPRIVSGGRDLYSEKKQTILGKKN
jgi:hypothetical protein